MKVAGCPTGLSKRVFVYFNNTFILESPSFSLLSEVTAYFTKYTLKGFNYLK